MIHAMEERYGCKLDESFEPRYGKDLIVWRVVKENADGDKKAQYTMKAAHHLLHNTLPGRLHDIQDRWEDLPPEEACKFVTDKQGRPIAKFKGYLVCCMQDNKIKES